jgi:hydrogenase nickel incorporation protein HypA/HybF
MHELSIAQNIIDLIHEHVPAGQRPQVRTVRVRVGEQAGVVTESLRFCFTALTAETDFASAVLDIEDIPFRVRCTVCGTEGTNDLGLPLCAVCGGGAEILAGTELNVKDIVLEEPAEQFP